MAEFELLRYRNQIDLQYILLTAEDRVIFYIEWGEINSKIFDFSTDTISFELPDSEVMCFITVKMQYSNIVYSFPISTDSRHYRFRIIFWLSNLISVNYGNEYYSKCMQIYKLEPSLYPTIIDKMSVDIKKIDAEIKNLSKQLNQYNYKYIISCVSGNGEIMLKALTVYNADGTFDKRNDGELMKYHTTGIPSKIAIQWHVKKSEYTAYFWFEDEEICAIFDKFYGAHRDTKTDFIIHIDVEKNKYELALYRYGLKEPQVIAESAYQLIVFKNKFECYRSENYDQPKGAWIW